MEIFKWFGVSISEAFQTLKTSEPVISYHNTEGEEFIEVIEKGFFLHSFEGQGTISDIRIYFQAYNDFFESNIKLRGKYGKLKTMSDFESELGRSEKDIRIFSIPGVPPTLPGKIFRDGARKISAYSENGNDIIYIHVKEELR